MSHVGYIISTLVVIHTILNIVILFGLGVSRWMDRKKPKKARKEVLVSGAFDSAMGIFYAMFVVGMLWSSGPVTVIDGLSTLFVFFILYSYLEMLFSGIYLLIKKLIIRRRGSAPELVPA